eukprot:TRINITY_DN4832_c0_g1_i1.p1 TRINITY_DN4832_c0_g1~~TRINITY_DN4832_c0_g1_i1.p1  ORF type:complete len:65 (-),score=10.53 TRINITY_DN4832_c0_g1_i1:31-225(-)
MQDWGQIYEKLDALVDAIRDSNKILETLTSENQTGYVVVRKKKAGVGKSNRSKDIQNQKEKSTD